MSSMDGYNLEYFVDDSFMGITLVQQQAIVALLEPERESIEYKMSDYDRETQSWRDYRNGLWYNLEQYQPMIENILNPAYR
jgi:hypothetical protein